MNAGPMATSPGRTPPRVRAAFRIGVVGHRPNRLHEADLNVLRALVGRIGAVVVAELNRVQDTSLAAGPELTQGPILRVISPLAEGTDRLVADVGLDLGASLCCPMPFAQTEYERDFSEPVSLEHGSLACFRGILARARTTGGLAIYELDGDRGDEGAAYGATGRVVINQSDLLIGVWDGHPAHGGGGTVQTMREAVQLGVPVLWIDAHAPHSWRMITVESGLPSPEGNRRCSPVSDPAEWAKLSALVSATLRWPDDAPTLSAPPATSPSAAPDPHSEYFREIQPRLNLAFAWKLFRNVVGESRLRAQSLRVTDFETQVAEEWPVGDCLQKDDPDATDTLICVNRALRPHFAWADRLADLYGDKYRSASIVAFPLSAAAVFLALLPAALAPWVQHGGALTAGCVAAEFGVITCIFALVLAARRGRWHERWMDYRLLAETIRQIRILLPLGGGRPFVRQPAHLATYGDPARSWVFAHMRAIARATGLPTARIDARFIRECLAYVAGVVRDQIAFHKRSAQRCERIEHRLHRIAFSLGLLTVSAILIHLAPHVPLPGGHGWHLPVALAGWLTFACASFPTLAAALAGISHQGEFGRVAKRSHAMAARFGQLARDLERLEQGAASEPATLHLDQVTRLATEAAQLMVDEVLDWRVVFLDRPPILPS